MRPDESFDVRRNGTFGRLKTRTERDHRVVSATDGVLIVDGVPVFSLKMVTLQMKSLMINENIDLSIGTYNFCGYNECKPAHIYSLLSRGDVLFIQEHRLLKLN